MEKGHSCRSCNTNARIIRRRQDQTRHNGSLPSSDTVVKRRRWTSYLGPFFIIIGLLSITTIVKGDEYNSSSSSEATMVEVTSRSSMIEGNDTMLIPLFEEYLTAFNKHYDDPVEYQQRFQAWKRSRDFVETYRQEHPDALFTMDLNHMSDRTDDDHKKMFGFKLSKEKIRQREEKEKQQREGDERQQHRHRRQQGFVRHDPTDRLPNTQDGGGDDGDDDYHGLGVGGGFKPMSSLPSSVDWRTASANPGNVVAVTPIKNQGACGACWGFTTVGAIEGAVASTTKILNELSVQEMIDCVSGNDGCNGGDFDYSFEYGKNGLSSSSDYQFQQGPSGSCQAGQYPIASKISSYHQTSVCSTTDILNKVATRPVAVAIDASCDAFIHYSGGIFTDSCGSDLNHAVLIIGYGTESGTEYWLVKNSWGSGWGSSGYGKVQRGVGACGVSNMEEYGYYAAGGIAYVNGTGFHNDDSLDVDSGLSGFLSQLLRWKYLTLVLGILIALLSLPLLLSGVRTIRRIITGAPPPPPRGGRGQARGGARGGGAGARGGRPPVGSGGGGRQAPLLPRGQVLDAQALSPQDLARLYALQNSAQPPNRPFQCAYCTFMNDAGRTTCAMCGNVHQFVEINDGIDREIVVLT